MKITHPEGFWQGYNPLTQKIYFAGKDALGAPFVVHNLGQARLLMRFGRLHREVPRHCVYPNSFVAQTITMMNTYGKMGSCDAVTEPPVTRESLMENWEAALSKKAAKSLRSIDRVSRYPLDLTETLGFKGGRVTVAHDFTVEFSANPED